MDQEQTNPQEQGVIDITINNVVSCFSVRCHLDLRNIARTGANVQLKKEKNMLIMKIRKPLSTARIWSSGKITCIGATSEEFAKVASRKFSRILQKIGYPVKIANYRVVNVLGTCAMPFGINLVAFTEKNRKIAEYEPEIHCGVTVKIADLKATMKLFSTGSICVTAPNVLRVQEAVERIYPLVFEVQKPLDPSRRKAPNPIEEIELDMGSFQKPKKVLSFNESEDDDDYSD